MAYIDTKYLGKCETCRHDISGKCDVWCENGEFYSPNLSKIPTADVVEVVRCKDCIIRGTSDCPFVYYSDMFAENEDPTEDTDFCSHGERKKVMFDFTKAEMLEPTVATETHKYIEEFATKISAEIVEKQEELILTTIQIIGGDEFIDITIDKDKVIEALTDYVNKQKGIPNIEVRHGEWIYHECVSSYEGAISGYSCSVCSSFVDEEIFESEEFHKKHCGNCGAKLVVAKSATTKRRDT